MSVRGRHDANVHRPAKSKDPAPSPRTPAAPARTPSERGPTPVQRDSTSKRHPRPRSSVPPPVQRVPRAAIRIAEWARTHVPLYRDLYAGQSPVAAARDFRNLPVLTLARLRATPLIDQIDTPDDLLRTFTSYGIESAAPAPAIPADQGDTDAAFAECHAAFALAGVSRASRVVLLCAPAQRYMAAEWAEQLGYHGVQTHVVPQLDDDATTRAVTALEPDVIAGVGTAGTATLRPSVTLRDRFSPGPDLYVVPDAGIVAVRPAGDDSYIPLPGHYWIEEEDDGGLLLTALRRYHRPLVRFEMPDRGRVVDGRLYLDEVVP